jgi:hypothetical protein
MTFSGKSKAQTVKGIIFDCREGGLCNRLRALVGYKTLSTLRGVPFYLHWKSNARCNAELSELFRSNFFVPIDGQTVDSLAKSNEADVYTGLEWFSTIWRKHAREEISWSRFAKAARQTLLQLQPQEAICRRVGEYVSSHKIDQSVGIHIRNTDNLKFYQRWAGLRRGVFDQEAVSKLEAFTRVILENANSGSGCFLATDDPVLEAMLLKTYGSALSVFPKKYVNPDGLSSIRTTPIEDALTELLLLSQCRSVVGTYYSSFSKLSAIWSGTTYFEARGSSIVKNRAVERMQVDMGMLRERCPWWRRYLIPLQPLL